MWCVLLSASNSEVVNCFCHGTEGLVTFGITGPQHCFNCHNFNAVNLVRNQTGPWAEWEKQGKSLSQTLPERS